MMADHEHLIPCPRRPLGSHRTAAAEGAAQAEGWSPSRPGSCRPRWHRLRPANGLPVAAAPEGTGLRQRHDLLAATAGLAGGRRLGAAARDAAQLARGRGGHRLESGQRGQPERPGQKGGEQTGPNPVDRGKPGSKYHLVVDRNGIPLGRSALGSQRPRRHAAAPTGRCHPADHRSTGEARSSSQAPGQAPRRQGLRLLRLTPRPARPRHHPTHCAPRDRLLASGWAGTAGWWSARSPGCSAVAASACATSGGPTCSRGCSTWPAP